MFIRNCPAYAGLGNDSRIRLIRHSNHLTSDFPKRDRSAFFFKMSNFERGREGSNYYCVEVQFHLFWLRREGIHESYA